MKMPRDQSGHASGTNTLGTNQVVQTGTNTPVVAPTNSPTISTNTPATTNQPAPPVVEIPVPEESTLSLTNASNKAVFTFTSLGGGVKRVDLLDYPKGGWTYLWTAGRSAIRLKR